MAETLDSLKKSLKTSKELKDVISSMKSITTANIKIYEKVVDATNFYRESIEQGLIGLVNYNKKINIYDNMYVKKAKKEDKIIIVFGSNQGLCGKFNNKILDFVFNETIGEKNKFIVIGERLSLLMENKKCNIIKTFPLPNSNGMLIYTIIDIVSIIQNEFKEKRGNTFYLYYTSHDTQLMGAPVVNRLIPFDKKLLSKIKNRSWQTKNVPLWRLPTEQLFTNFVEQYIYIVLNNALANSIASELKNRSLTLQNAEKNINDIIKKKNNLYNQKRQTKITGELLDVVSGFKASKKNSFVVNN